MPLIKIVDPTPSANARPRRPARSGLRAWRALEQHATPIAFSALHAFFAIRDRLAALRDRLPAKPDMSGSTMLAYVAVGIMAAILVNDLIAPTPAVSSVTPAPEKKPDWIEIVRPHAAFALEADALHGLESRYLVRRHRTGGGRSDELIFGSADGRGPYVRMSAYRPGAEGMAERTALDAAATVVAAAGIDAKLDETGAMLKTKFGMLPIVGMTVPGGHGIRNCLAAAGAWDDPRFRLLAWWCNDGPEIVAQGEFACLIDRFALMSAGGDEQLAEFFARAELRRNYCDVHGSFVSPTPRLVTDWIHNKRVPRLRGQLGVR